MTPEKIWVGIDVCQACLDENILPQGSTLQVANNEAGVQTLIEHLQQTPPHLVVAESTGGLERQIVGSLHRGIHSRSGSQSAKS